MNENSLTKAIVNTYANHSMRYCLKYDFIKNVLRHSCIFESSPTIPTNCCVIRHPIA